MTTRPSIFRGPAVLAPAPRQPFPVPERDWFVGWSLDPAMERSTSLVPPASTHYGRFITLDRGRTIEHTWVSEATRGLETVVHVALEPRDGKTHVTLRHTGIPDDEMGRGHEAGWTWLWSAIAERFEAGRSRAPGAQPSPG